MKLDKNIFKIDYKKASEEIYNFIQQTVSDANASGVVVGLSGGVDSSLAVTLCVEALGKTKVLGLVLPTWFTPKKDVEDAFKLAEKLDITTKLLNIDEIYSSLVKSFKIEGEEKKFRLALSNIYARIRMIILYFYANIYNYLVVGTSDRSENLIGFFTKHGDGAGDFFPIRHLYKTQVRYLAKYLGVNSSITWKPSSPQLYPNHDLRDELPLRYNKLDPILKSLTELNMTVEEISELVDVPLEIVIHIRKRYNETDHKRILAPSLD